MTPAEHNLLDEPNAWLLVLQWASDEIAFQVMVDTLTERFGDRYVPDDWKALFNRVFSLSDPGEDIEDADRVTLSVAAVEAEMTSRGVLLIQPGPSLQSATVSSKAAGKRKTNSSPCRTQQKKRIRSSINRFLDTEAVVDVDANSSEDEESSDDFIAPDALDLGAPVRLPPTRVYPVAGHTGSSTYQQAVEKIANRFMPSSLADLDDAEYHRRHDEFYGIDGQEEEGDDEVSPDENTNLQVLDSAGIWNAIREWMFGTMNYPTLLDLIDFQHDYDSKIQYWEDFLSRLAFLQDLKERESLFNSVSLADHLVCLTSYRPQSEDEVLSGFEPQSSHTPSPKYSTLEVPERLNMWAVNIVPHSSVNYIIKAWQNASIQSTTHKLLPGRVTVCASYPNLFLHTVPSSHRSCVRGWSLIPFEDHIQFPIPTGPSLPMPGWYTVSKRGLYKGDIGYAIFFDRETAELHLLVAPRQLELHKPTPCKHGKDPDTRCLFSPGRHQGRQLRPYRGLVRYEYRKNVFISGLLLMKMKASYFKHQPTPSPSQIALHVASLVDPPFMNSTRRKYNEQYWKPDDRVTVSDTCHGDTWGHLVSIDVENSSALVRLAEGSEYLFPLSSLSRLYRVGDVVRVLSDPFSDDGYVHHLNLGRSGIICEVDPLVDEITIQDSPDTQIRVPGFLLESHLPEQPLYAPFGVLTPTNNNNDNDSVQIGDLVELREGDMRGYVTEVRSREGNLTFVSMDRGTPSFSVACISAVHFTPDHRVLKYTSDKGYDVKSGNHVIVMRGEHRGKEGIVSQVHPEEKLLTLDTNSRDCLTLPIIHCAPRDSVCYRDEGDRHLEKEVLIIAGPNKGWRGTLVSCGPDTCVVSRVGHVRETYKKEFVVVRGLAHTLGGRLLTPLEVLQASCAFAHAEISYVLERPKTPIPDPGPQSDLVGSSTPNPWVIDDSEREELISSRPALTVHDFMLHPNVVESLKTVRAVFQISPGWRDTYTGRLAKTDFESASGPAPRGHLAVRLTARTKGAHLMHEFIPETSLDVYRPVKRGTLCMVIKGTEGGEPIGSLLSVTKASTKEQKVHVQHLNGTPSSEAVLPFSRVIVVEPL